MRFSLSGSPQGGVRFIPTIPEGQLVKLEGRNGIGKTVAVRLLQLVTGGQPYITMRSAWQTLGEQLGHVEITVDGLKDGRSLRFEIEPSETWPGSPAEPPGPWLGSVFLDGKEIDWDHVPRILRVARIGGDESLQQSLSDHVSADGERLARVLDVARPRSEVLDQRLEDLQILLAAASPAALEEASSAVELAKESLSSSEADVEVATAALAAAARLGDVHDHLRALRAELPEIDAQLAATDVERRTLEEQLEALDLQRLDVLGQERQAQELAPQLDQLERLLRLRLDRAAGRRREVESLASRAGLSYPVEESVIRPHRSALQARLRELTEQRRTLDVSGLVRTVIEDIQLPLDDAIQDGLGNEVIWVDRGEHRTIGDLREGLDQRADELGAEVASDELVAVLREIGQVEARSAAAGQLPRIVRLERKAEDDVEETDANLQDLIGRVGGAGSDLAGLEEQRRRLFAALTNLGITKADLDDRRRDLYALGSEEDLEAELGAAGLDIDRVPSVIAEREHERSLALAAQDEATRRWNAAEDALRETLDRADRALRRIRSDDEFAWLQSLQLDLPSPKASTRQQVEALEPVQRAVEEIRRLVKSVSTQGDALTSVLGGLAGRLGRNEQAAADEEGRSAMRGAVAHYERFFTGQFSAQELKSALFENGTDISVDLWGMRTSWVARGGERRTRPLEAFSSGERAFAYTRVQLERVADERADNVCVFLDEFGAYVAHDRLDELMAFIKNQAIGRIADKVVVVLPLATQPRGSGAEALKRDGYLAEVLQ